nr:MAG: hypothetical protein [Beijing sediment noda-like virus 2]
MLEVGLLIAVIIPSVPVGWRCMRRCWSRHSVRSHITSWASKKFSPSPETLRSMFRDLPVPEMKPARNHTHGLAAKHRSASSSFAETFASSLGLEPYFYQRSRADERKGRVGSRSYYWIKDLTAKPTGLKRHSRQLLILIDVDEYMDDLIEVLGSIMQPVMIYTFQPGTVSENKGDYTFTFDENSRVKYIVNGGAKYEHHVWNYNADNLMVEVYSCGVLVRAVAYLVDKRQVDKHHQIILLTPICRWVFPFTYLTYFLDGHRLARLDLVNNGFLEMYSMHKDELRVSVGVVNGFTCCDIPVADFDYLLAVHRTSKSGLTHAQVKIRTGVEISETCQWTAILLDFIRTTEPRWVLMYNAEFSHDYQFYTDKTDFDAPASMVSFMAPIVDGAFAPVRSTANYTQAVNARILEVRSSRTLEPVFLQYAKEFFAFMGAKQNLYPVTVDVVYERQARPTQRRILEEADFLTPQPIMKAFMKREAYQKPADPRVITTVDPVIKTRKSQFVYAVDDLVQSQPWYAFGSTPKQIANRVACICYNARSICITDYSKWDGHYSPAQRSVALMFFLSVFHPMFHQELLDMEREHGGIIVYFCDLMWKAMSEINSGTPETSLVGTLGNAFISYCTHRVSGLVPEEAWRNLGVYGGDDGITPNVNIKIFRRTASRFGQVLDAKIINRGEPGVQFLNRIYSPRVWDGDVNSCCDIRRALTKFHVTIHMPASISPEEKLADKAFAYWLSDRHTPVLGEFVTTVVALLPRYYVFRNITRIYNAYYDESEQYPNSDTDWMMDLYMKQLPHEGMNNFFMWLHDQQSLTSLLNPPCLFIVDPQPHNDQPVILDGDFLLPSRRAKQKSRALKRALVKKPGDNKTGDRLKSKFS